MLNIFPCQRLSMVGAAETRSHLNAVELYAPKMLSEVLRIHVEQSERSLALP